MLGPDDRPLDLDDVGERVAELHRRRPPRRRRVRHAQPARASPPGLDWRQVDDPARLPQVPPARSARASPRATRTTCWRPTRRSRPSSCATSSCASTPRCERDEAAEAALRDEILADLDAVASLDHDRILRNQLAADRRDAAHERLQRRTARRSRSSCARPTCRRSRSRRRCSRSTSTRPTMEGIHLRGGQIARGGLRWSDRQDYRTEVYGLMRAQLTKNAVIVPAGAKGGFYLKQPPGGPRRAARPRSSASTSRYIRGAARRSPTTSSTARSCTPSGVRVLDDDDTYLVVAADKGTATFSDTANRVSRASTASGSTTRSPPAARPATTTRRSGSPRAARGSRSSATSASSASTRQADEFTVVGIGDMSGDVFGNGMLLSRHDPARRRLRPPARLHRPRSRTPATAFAERKRLFELAGLVVGRLRPRADLRGRRRLAAHARSRSRCRRRRARRSAIEDERAARPPTSSARSCARRSTCCGTAASARWSRRRRDRRRRARTAPRDAIRVDARELRCRVVGEGGNLGLTRRARVEFAARRRAASTPTSSTTRPASTAPTTRST